MGALAVQEETFGGLLRSWRQRRRVSQLDLAIDADVSSRHISFLETGRARPSREMVIKLTEELEVPLRHRNRLLVAAGFAPVFPEREVHDPRLRLGTGGAGQDPGRLRAVPRAGRGRRMEPGGGQLGGRPVHGRRAGRAAARAGQRDAPVAAPRRDGRQAGQPRRGAGPPAAPAAQAGRCRATGGWPSCTTSSSATSIRASTSMWRMSPVPPTSCCRCGSGTAPRSCRCSPPSPRSARPWT